MNSIYSLFFFMVIAMNVTEAKNIYYDVPQRSNSSSLKTITLLTDSEQNEIFTYFNKIKKFQEVEGNDRVESKFLPIELFLFSETKDDKNIRIIVNIKNNTDNKWFFPSPFQYFGNKFLSIKSKKDFNYYPGLPIKNRPITNDSTMMIINSKDEVNIIYSLNMSNYCSIEDYLIDFYVDQAFLPVYISKKQEKLIKARIISNNKLTYNCNKKSFMSLDNNFDPRKLSDK